MYPNSNAKNFNELIKYEKEQRSLCKYSKKKHIGKCTPDRLMCHRDAHETEQHVTTTIFDPSNLPLHKLASTLQRPNRRMHTPMITETRE